MPPSKPVKKEVYTHTDSLSQPYTKGTNCKPDEQLSSWQVVIQPPQLKLPLAQQVNKSTDTDKENG